MIDVAHLITGLDVGGAETMLARLVTRSDRERFSHRVISMAPAGAMAAPIQDAGIPVESLHMRPGAPDPVAIARLAKILRRSRPHLLQGWMYHANLLASVVGSAFRVPVLWNIRAVPDVNYGRQVAAINAVLARMSGMPAAVVINSEYGREFHARQGYHPVRWNVIPNGFDTSILKPDPDARQRLRQEWGIGNDEPLVGLVARLDPVKDHLTFLRAARALADQTSGVRFVCVGSGPEAYQQQLHKAVRSLQLTDCVIWAGARADIVAVNNALDVATCASLSESFPNVVGEAMACGTPCVVTDVGDSRHLVGSTGVVVRPGEPAAMAAAWATMLTSGPSQLEDRGLRARQRIVEHFGLDRIVGEYEKLYSGLVRSA